MHLFPFLLATLFAATDGQAARPNVILVLADDLGAKELSCYGSTRHQTPNLDRMAAEGMRFETFDVNPLCTPTRVALMTGRQEETEQARQCRFLRLTFRFTRTHAKSTCWPMRWINNFSTCTIGLLTPARLIGDSPNMTARDNYIYGENRRPSDLRIAIIVTTRPG